MKQRTKIGPDTFHCIEIDSMPQNTPTITPKATDIYTTVYASTVREHSTTDGASYRIHSSWSSPTRARELNSPMAAGLPGSSFGVLLPVCLLAMFLSCVVCVYHWQGTRERRLDLEDDRKRMRKRKLSEVDSGCAWRTVKPVYKVRWSLIYTIPSNSCVSSWKIAQSCRIYLYTKQDFKIFNLFDKVCFCPGVPAQNWVPPQVYQDFDVNFLIYIF